MLTLITGVLYVVAGLGRLDFFASFLSQPILTGYLNRSEKPRLATAYFETAR